MESEWDALRQRPSTYLIGAGKTHKIPRYARLMDRHGQGSALAYVGRAIHIHLIAHINATENKANNTLEGGHVAHVGQLFFDQDLIDSVESLYPYTTNTQPRTTNQQDPFLPSEAKTSNPVFNYVLLDDDDVSKGIFSWITVGINPTVSKPVYEAAYLDSDGVHVDPTFTGFTLPTQTPR